jgi:spore germination cell wall hydrolase CwlJ-like protein
MIVAGLAAAYVVLAQTQAAAPAPPAAAFPPIERSTPSLAAVVNTPEARDAMARVVWAEAGNQGESGLAGVVYTVLNRLIDGRWGGTVETVVDAPGQFEPVMRAGGTWRRLAPVTAVQEATVHTIVELALQGRLPDLTGGARYFQNRRIVAARAAAGLVSERLVGFGGAAPSAQIGDHTFYPGPARRAAGASRRHRSVARAARAAKGAIFFDERQASPQAPGVVTPSEPDWGGASGPQQ